MRSIRIAAILGVLGILGFAESDTNAEVVFGEGAGFEVPEHLEPVFSWPPGSFVDCGECFQNACNPENDEHWFGNEDYNESVDRAYGEETHLDCWSGTCAEKHPEGQTCDSTTALSDVDKQTMWRTGVMGIPSALASLVAGFRSARTWWRTTPPETHCRYEDARGT